ncbi:MAG: hypothetical protein ABI882_19685 [Acidobacteriota bacterium]
MSLLIKGEPDLIWGELVSGNYFEVLKTNPALGRSFIAEEDRAIGTTRSSY